MSCGTPTKISRPFGKGKSSVFAAGKRDDRRAPRDFLPVSRATEARQNFHRRGILTQKALSEKPLAVPGRRRRRGR